MVGMKRPNAGPLMQPKRRPWRELGVLRDVVGLRRLNTSALARGSRNVFVLPGFQTGDSSTWVLRRALSKAGHSVRGWGLGINRGNVRTLIPKLIDTLSREREPVHLVGWSLGGFIAREIAREIPERVGQVITMASPVVGGPKYTAAASHYIKKGINLDVIERTVAERDHTHPLTVPVTALYSLRDSVVCPAACIDGFNEHVEHIEVDCGHIAFGFNREVIRIVAGRLAGHDER